MADYTEPSAPLLRSRLGKALGSGICSGLLTLVDPAKLRPSSRASLYIGSALIPAGLIWLATGAGGDSAGTKHGRLFRASVAAGLGAVGAAGTKFGFAVDEKIHQALLRRGLENPRPLMAVSSGLLMVAMSLLEPSRPEAKVEQGPAEPEVGTRDPLSS